MNLNMTAQEMELLKIKHPQAYIEMLEMSFNKELQAAQKQILDMQIKDHAEGPKPS